MKRLLFSILLFLSISGFTQQFTRITSVNGLSQNWVRCIYQDEVGYMWFGTAGGLDRYNGYDFKKFDVGNNNVNAFIEYAPHEILICTDNGIFIFNVKSEKLRRFELLEKFTVLCVAKNKNTFWFGTNLGLFRYNSTSKKLQKYKTSSEYINTIVFDSKSELLVGSKLGLSIYNSAKDVFENIESSNNIDIQAICDDKKEFLFIGTLQNGLDVIDIHSKRLIKHIFNGNVTSLLIDTQRNLWIAKGNGEGLQKIDLKTDSTFTNPQITSYKTNPADLKSISDNSIFCLYQDNQKDLWIGTFGGGIDYISSREKQFNRIIPVQENIYSSNLVNCILEDSTFIWIGTETGLLQYNKKQKSYNQIENNSKSNKGIVGCAVYAIKNDSKGNLWIGTWSGGLNRYNYRTKTFKHYIPDGSPKSLSNENVYSLWIDKNDELWVGTVGGGLNKFNDKNETFTSYRFDKKKQNCIAGDFVNDIFGTNTGELLLSNFYAFDIFTPKTNNFKRIIVSEVTETLNKTSINVLFQDSKKHIWIGTNKGLKRLNEDQKTFTNYTNEQGLIDNYVNGIEEDNHNNLWLTTKKGIVKFIGGVNLPEIPQFINFTTEDGIAGNESKNHSIYKNKNGIIYIGSSNGITYFYPDSIKLNSSIPKIAITELLLLNTLPNKNASYIPIDRNVNDGKTININYNNSNFSIKFAALNYFNTDKNQYKYMLEGYDSTWINVGNERIITYTNIQPGNYTFKVIASNNDGLWNSNPQVLKIEILPPWWSTYTFKFLIISIIIFCFVLFYRMRISSVKKQKKVLEQTVQSRTKALNAMNSILRENQHEIKKQNLELFEHRNNLEQLVTNRTSELEIAMKKAEENDKLKTAFLQNISHEIRTPMNAIIGFSNLLKQKDLSVEEVEQFVNIINSSCNQLLAIINDIINIATIESGQAKINETKVNINAIIKIFYEQFKLKTDSKNINLSYKMALSDSVALFKIDEAKFIEIFSNLINNALKFTEKGSVEYGYEIHGEFLQFYVKDTGIGIATVQHDKIFERFRQAESTIASKYGGTGLGLSISKAYVELLGGKMWLTSVLGKGSEFYFAIPIKRIDKSNLLHKSSEEKQLPSNTYRGHILVVEDEEYNFRYLQKVLTIMRFSIERASNGIEAIEKCKKNSEINLILMDIKMPEMDGYEAVKQIRMFNKTIPIIAQTAYALSNDIEKIMKSGFDDYITKPIDKNLLFESIDKYFS